jgi:hypothetical protein
MLPSASSLFLGLVEVPIGGMFSLAMILIVKEVAVVTPSTETSAW